MAKLAVSEVEVLRFFETEPLDKVTVLFNIVSDKMRARLHSDNYEPPLAAPPTRRSKIGKTRETQRSEPGSDESHAILPSNSH